MNVPVGFIAKLWSLVSFLPFFVLLLLLGSAKALLIGPVVAAIVFLGDSAVIIGLWPAHFVWTYCCVLATKRIGPVLKILAVVFLPLPLLLLPVLGIVGSLLVGIGYGVFTPLMATFEAVGEGVADKLSHCFLDGTASTIRGACMVVRDVTDFCFHSYFSFMDELSEKMGDDEEPTDIKLSYLPRSFLVALVAVPLDVLMITGVALWKSPCMLLKGWQRLCEDLVGREGPFLETVCVPFAGLAIILWPLAVIAGVIASFLSSFFFGLHAGLIAYQEASFQMGLSYMISAVALYDEYTNDLLYLREGSCLPRQAQVPESGFCEV
uniref:Steroid nuclear receptor ligand-binding n=1 Tax=Aegilops tauschii subsp. strangulata TaxID=200361 RepID=A0A453RD90_AEGTS